MAVLPIITWPNPVLIAPTQAVTEFDESLETLINDMVETMYAAPGLGLAAPQVAVSKKIFVIAAEAYGEDSEREWMAYINPEIVESEGESTMEEGCLSFPNVFVAVKRPARVKVRSHTVKGEIHEEWLDGLAARAIQHELDHLDGVLLLNRVSRLKREFIKKKMRKAAASASAR